MDANKYTLSIVALVLTLFGFVDLSLSQNLHSVNVHWTENGEQKTQMGVQPGTSFLINRDAGTRVDVTLFKKNNDGFSFTYYSADFINSIQREATTTAMFQRLNNIAGANNTDVWVYMENELSDRVTVEVRNIIPAEPDLIVNNLRVNGTIQPRNYESGEEIQIDANVFNLGDEVAGSSKLGYFLGRSEDQLDKFIGSVNIPSINPNTGRSSRMYYTFTDSDVGEYQYIVLKADYLNDVDEANENNNILSFGPFNVVPEPISLIITSVEPSETLTKELGESYTYQIIVEDSDGNKVDNAHVEITDNVLSKTYSRTTSSNGQTQYSNIVPEDKTVGGYNLTFVASKDGYKTSEIIQRNMNIVRPEYDAIIVTVDGIDGFSSLFKDITGQVRETNYLSANLNQLNLTRNVHVEPFPWSGDLNETSAILPCLKELLLEKRKMANDHNAKFVVIGHSWGTVLSFLALAELSDQIETDMYITLSTPLGMIYRGFSNDTEVISPKINPNSDYYLIESFIAAYYLYQTSQSIYNFLVNVSSAYQNSNINADRMINAWASKDLISGPLSRLNKDFKDIRVSGGLRDSYKLIQGQLFIDLGTTIPWHEYTKLKLNHPLGSGLLNYVTDEINSIIENTVPPPIPEIVQISVIPEFANKNELFTFDIIANNLGGDGDYGSITVSFPTVDVQNYNNIVSLNGNTTNQNLVDFFPAGDSRLNHRFQSDFTSNYLTVEYGDNNWSSGKQQTLSLNINPEQTGEFIIDIRVNIQNSNTGYYLNNPINSDHQDQQGWEVYRYIVNVLEEAQPIISGPSNLLYFDDIQVGDVSDIISYNIKGSNLQGQLTIEAPDGFEISSPQSTSFSSSLQLSPNNGSIDEIIAVRFRPTIEASYVGEIVHKTSGASDFTISVVGVGKGSSLSELIVSPLSKNLIFGSGEFELKISKNSDKDVHWQASIIEGNNWMSITSSSSGTNDGHITVSYSENSSTSDRKGEIEIISDAVSNSPVFVTVTQKSYSKQYQTWGKFAVTLNTIPSQSDWGTAVDSIIGTEYRVADWNDLVDYHSSGKNILELFDKLGLTEYNSSAAVYRSGEKIHSSSSSLTRYYFVSRHENNKPDNYLAHENIDNYTISLGSWEGDRVLLAYKDSFTDPPITYTGTISDSWIRFSDNRNQQPEVYTIEEISSIFEGGTPPISYEVSSSDPSIAIAELIDDNAMITAAGTSIQSETASITISASDDSGQQASGSFDVTVVPAYGDVNADGSVNSLDASQILQYAVELMDFTDVQLEVADLDQNGVVNSFDASLVLQYAVELIDELPFNTSSMAKAGDTGTLYWGTVIQQDGELIIPLIVEGADVHSIDFTGQISAPGVNLDAVEVTGTPDGWMSMNRMTDNNELHLAMAGTSSATLGVVANLHLKLDGLNHNVSLSGSGYVNSREYELERLELREIPSEFTLDSNYPNPFNPTTTLSYQLPVDADVRIDIYNITGQRVLTVAEGQQRAGSYTPVVDMSNFASGVYIIRMQAISETQAFRSARKMTLIK